MTESMQRILGYVLLAALIVIGGYVTLSYFAVGVHQSVMLDDPGKTLLQTSCEGRGVLCNGLLTIPASIIALFGSLQPFMLYAFFSVLLALGFAMRTFMRDGVFMLRFSLSPAIVLVLFVLSTWGMMMTIAFSSDNGIPLNKVIEPTPEVYQDIGVEGLQTLRANFEDLQERGCLSPSGQTLGSATVYNYSVLCMQMGFLTRVLSQILLLLFIGFSALVLGRAVLHLLRLKDFPLLPEGVLSVGLGACMLVAILWLLSLLGAYTMIAGWALVVFVPLVLFRHSLSWLRALWHETWHVELKPWSIAIILGWLLLSYLALNFLNVVRPFPIGWDDLGRYLNQPRLLVSYGHFIPTLPVFSWEFITSLGFLLFGFESTFGATSAMLLNWSAGLLAVMVVLTFARTYLGEGRGMLSALLYYSLPMVGHFSFADMKVDNAIFAIGTLAGFAVFLAVMPPPGIEDDEEHSRMVAPLLILAGLFAGFAFAMKPTAIMLIMAVGSVMVGARLGWMGFLGAMFLAWAVFAVQGVLKLPEVSARVLGDSAALSTMAVTSICLIVGFALIGYALRGRTAELNSLLKQLGLFLAAFVVAILPWLTLNNIGYGHFPPRIELSYPNETAPTFILDGRAPPDNDAPLRALPLELQLDPNNPACVSTSKSEELDRYWGDYPGIGHYLGLPWRAVMNTDAFGYYVTLIPALLLVPLLLFVPAFWRREEKWMRYLAGATLFMVVEWMFMANGIVWYGISMFIGLVVLLEALVVASPTKSTRWLTAVLIGLSLVAAFSHRIWQFGLMQNIFEYPMAKVSAETMEERTIPHYDDIRDVILDRAQSMPERPYVYRMGTFIPYFIPRNFEVLPLADNQLDMFNCLNQERDPALTLRRLQVLGFNSMIFDTNTQTIERDPNGSLHKKVQAFLDFINTPGLGMRIVVQDTGAGIAFILLP